MTSLDREPHGSGWQVQFRASGIGRFFPALFMMVWLCGWALGEVFASVTLLAGLHAVGILPQIPGVPAMRGTVPSSGAIPVLLFLAFWLTIWTFAGWAALRETFRLLVGRDLVRWDAEGIEIQHFAGPFRSRVHVARDEVLGLQFASGGRALVLDSLQGRRTLTAFGSTEDRRELEAVLRSHLQGWGAVAAARAPQRTPSGWHVFTDDEGREALSEPWPFGGREIRVHPNGVRYEWRFGWWRQQREITPVSLLIRKRQDSDGDEVWELVAKAPDHEQRLANAINDPSGVRHLGRWLAARAGVELQDAA